MTEVDLIEVQLEDLVLVVLRFDLAGDLRFLDFPHDAFLARDLLRKDVARELHRDGGKALRVSVDRRADNDASRAVPVDAGVLVEALVLGGDERVPHDLGDLVDLYEGAPLEAELGDEPSVDRVELGSLVRCVLAQNFDGGALAAAADERPRAVERAGTERDEEGEREQHHSHERRVTPVEWDLVGVG